MRILLFANILYPFHIDIADEFSKVGVTVKVFTLGIFGNYPFETLLNSVEKIATIKISTLEIISITAIFNIIRFKPDVLMLFGSESLSGILFYLLSKLLGIKPVIIVEENNITRLKGLVTRILQKIRMILNSQIYSEPLIIAESIASRKYVEGILQIKRNSKLNIHVHGVNTQKFKHVNEVTSFNLLVNKYNFPGEIIKKFKFLFVGELSYQKGADVLLDSIVVVENNCKLASKYVFLLPKWGELLKNKNFALKLISLGKKRCCRAILKDSS